MNFNDRDTLTAIYYQIYVKDIKPEKLNIDYSRLERLYQDPKTFPKYKTIIKDILKASASSKLYTNNSTSTQEIDLNDSINDIQNLKGSGYYEGDLIDLCANINFNQPLIYNFAYLKKILTTLIKCESLNYEELKKINQLIKTLVFQSVFAKKPELEFVILRNLILIIIKFGVFDKVERTGLVDLDIKKFLSLTTNSEFQSYQSNEINCMYIIDSRLEIIYLLLRNNYELFRRHYYTLLKCLTNKSSSSAVSYQSPELRIKWIKLITNLIIENKIHISEKLFETKILLCFIKLIPEINIDMHDIFTQELLNSIRLLLEHYCSTLNYIKDDENFVNLQQLMEISDIKEGGQFKDEVNINLLKLLIIIGIDANGYSYKRVITLFEKHHLIKLSNKKYNLSSEYVTLILKTAFYLHQWPKINVEDMDNELVKLYNNIENKKDLDDCPSPINYRLKLDMDLGYDNIFLSIEDMGKVNTIFLRSEQEMGFSTKEIIQDHDEKKLLYITRVPDNINTKSHEPFVEHDDENIEDEFDNLKLELKGVNGHKDRLFSNSLEAKKTSSISTKFKPSRLFGKK